MAAEGAERHDHDHDRQMAAECGHLSDRFYFRRSPFAVGFGVGHMVAAVLALVVE